MEQQKKDGRVRAFAILQLHFSVVGLAIRQWWILLISLALPVLPLTYTSQALQEYLNWSSPVYQLLTTWKALRSFPNSISYRLSTAPYCYIVWAESIQSISINTHCGGTILIKGEKELEMLFKQNAIRDSIQVRIDERLMFVLFYRWLLADTSIFNLFQK